MNDIKALALHLNHLSHPERNKLSLRFTKQRDGFLGVDRYGVDPEYTASIDAEVEANRREVNAVIDAGMKGLNAKQEARWLTEAQRELLDD